MALLSRFSLFRFAAGSLLAVSIALSASTVTRADDRSAPPAEIVSNAIRTLSEGKAIEPGSEPSGSKDSAPTVRPFVLNRVAPAPAEPTK